MTAETTTDTAGGFDLEAPLTPGEVPQRVIDELRGACGTASDYALAFNDAVKAQAEKHKVAPKALRRFIVALEGDKVKAAEKEAEDLQSLVSQHRGAEDA